MSNTQLVIKGPAIIRGQAVNNRNIFTKGSVTINKRMAMTPVGTDQHGVIDQRLEDVIHEISFTPSGRWAGEAEFLLPPLGIKYPGQKLIEETSVNITAVADGGSGECDLTLGSAATVYEGQYVTISASSVNGYVGTWRVASVTDSTHISIVMTYSAGATGTLKVPPCLIIHPLRNWSGSDTIHIYQWAGITKYPDLTLNGKDTLLSEMTVTALYLPYRSAEDTDSVVRYHTWSAPTSGMLDDMDVTDIHTLPPKISYATDGDTSAPWGEFYTLDGLKVSFSMGLDADKTDTAGTTNFTIGAVGCVAVCSPVGEGMSDEIIQRKLQQMEYSGTNGVRRGGRLGTATDHIFIAEIVAAGGTYQFSMPRAVIGDAAAAFGSATPRNGAVAFTAVRTLDAGDLVALFSLSNV